MTVPATARRAGPFTGNGVTTSFPFTFKVFAAADVEVTFTSSAGVESVLTGGYTVTLNADQDASPGGTVTYPTSGAALAATETLTLVGALDYDQTLDLPAGGSFSPRAIENALDRATMQIQQLAEVADRTLSLPVSAGGVSAQLPVPAANKAIGWNPQADGLVNLDVASLLASAAFAGWTPQIFTGDGVETDFLLTSAPGSLGNIAVAISGVVQVATNDYSLSGNVLTFTSPPPAAAVIFVRYGSAAIIGTQGTLTELKTSTEGQTVFTTVANWVPGSGMVKVYVDGWRVHDVVEGASNTLTLSAPLPAGREVLIEIGQLSTSGLDSSQVGFTPAGAGAVPRSVYAKLLELPTVQDKGAAAGSTVSQTAAIQAAVAEGVAWLPRGDYKTDTALTGTYGLVLIGDVTFSGAVPIDDGLPNFGNETFQVLAFGNKNAIVGTARNTLPPATLSFPTGVTGYGRNDNAGNVAFGGYFEARQYANTGVVTNEIDSFNHGAAPTNTTTPDRSIGTTHQLPNALTIGAGGTAASWLGVHITREGSSPQSFLYGMLFDAEAVTESAIVVEATALAGPTLPVLIKHRVANLAAQFQGVGTPVGANTWLQYADGSATVQQAFKQDGSIHIRGNKIIGTRATGWAAATGTATRTTFATGSVTTAQLAERVKALIDDLSTHGLIGA